MATRAIPDIDILQLLEHLQIKWLRLFERFTTKCLNLDGSYQWVAVQTVVDTTTILMRKYTFDVE